MIMMSEAVERSMLRRYRPRSRRGAIPRRQHEHSPGTAILGARAHDKHRRDRVVDRRVADALVGGSAPMAVRIVVQRPRPSRSRHHKQWGHGRCSGCRRCPRTPCPVRGIVMDSRGRRWRLNHRPGPLRDDHRIGVGVRAQWGITSMVRHGLRCGRHTSSLLRAGGCERADADNNKIAPQSIHGSARVDSRHISCDRHRQHRDGNRVLTPTMLHLSLRITRNPGVPQRTFGTWTPREIRDRESNPAPSGWRRRGGP